MDLDEIDKALLGAHATGDKPSLVNLYRAAGNHMLRLGALDAGCFYLTQAYIFALDCGDDQAHEIHKILVAHGREA